MKLWKFIRHVSRAVGWSAQMFVMIVKLRNRVSYCERRDARWRRHAGLDASSIRQQLAFTNVAGTVGWLLAPRSGRSRPELAPAPPPQQPAPAKASTSAQPPALLANRSVAPLTRPQTFANFQQTHFEYCAFVSQNFAECCFSSGFKL